MIRIKFQFSKNTVASRSLKGYWSCALNMVESV